MEENGVEKISWDEVSTNRFFTPDFDKQYKITFESATPVKKSFGKGEAPKTCVVAKLKTLNGEPSDLEWSTSSWAVINELRRQVEQKTLQDCVFLLVKKQEKGFTKYVFEVIAPVEGKQ